MQSYILNIAVYKIRFESKDDGTDLVPSERFHGFLCNDSDPDVFIKVYSGRYQVPEDATKVFNAPYVEETDGIRIKKKEKFWSVHKSQNDLFIKTSFPLSDQKKKGVLKFSPDSKEWELWIEGAGKETDPMEYPLDGLILYYMTAIHGHIMMHASGINNSGKGYIFSGISGKGKTTLAKLWDMSGSRVIHDDRLIIRKKGNEYHMFNTPVYKNDTPRESRIDRLFLIEHGGKNQIIPVHGAECISFVMANCIQHNWSREIIEKLLGSVSALCTEIPVSKLLFKPDNSIIDHILQNE